MSVGQRTWTTTAARRRIGRYVLRVAQHGAREWWWGVEDDKRGHLLADGFKPDEKAAKLAARRWVDAALREDAR